MWTKTFKSCYYVEIFSHNLPSNLIESIHDIHMVHLIRKCHQNNKFQQIFSSQTGTLVRRHRVPKPPPHDDEYYTVEDFNVDKEISIYSKVFKITSCDEFTNNFLRKLGVRVKLPNDVPQDPYSRYRKGVSI